MATPVTPIGISIASPELQNQVATNSLHISTSTTASACTLAAECSTLCSDEFKEFVQPHAVRVSTLTDHPANRVFHSPYGNHRLFSTSPVIPA
jgi:hypothetical protein